MVTVLGPLGVPRQPWGSFAGKAEASVIELLGPITDFISVKKIVRDISVMDNIRYVQVKKLKRHIKAR